MRTPCAEIRGDCPSPMEIRAERTPLLRESKSQTRVFPLGSAGAGEDPCPLNRTPEEGGVAPSVHTLRRKGGATARP